MIQTSTVSAMPAISAPPVVRWSFCHYRDICAPEFALEGPAPASEPARVTAAA